MRRLRAGIALIVITWPGAAVADTNAYDACIEAIAANPAQAEQQARSWVAEGGGAPARHCRAQALIALGARGNAIEILSDLGQRDVTMPDATRAEVLAQAASLLLAEGQPEMAATIAGQSLELARTGEGYQLLASAQAAQGDLGAALKTLDTGLERVRPSASLLIDRARLRRRLGQTVAARGDILWAFDLAPDAAAAFLELGRIEEALGQTSAARTAYLDAIANDAGGDIATAARLRLQKLEMAAN